jgi:ABC-type phosphate transport system substrate-binding protein
MRKTTDRLAACCGRAIRWLPLVGLLVATIGIPSSTGAAAGYKVVVHRSNPATSLSRQELTAYFLKRTTSWPSGIAVQPVDLERKSAARAAFSSDVLHKSVAQIIAYWQQQIFAGRAVPPPEKNTDAEIVTFVGGHQGAIGYVTEGAAVGDCRVVEIGK